MMRKWGQSPLDGIGVYIGRLSLADLNLNLDLDLEVVLGLNSPAWHELSQAQEADQLLLSVVRMLSKMSRSKSRSRSRSKFVTA